MVTLNLCLLWDRESYPMLLVANKVDLVHMRKVSEEMGRELAHRLNLSYIETSAKDPPLNVDSAFHEVGVWEMGSTLGGNKFTRLFHYLSNPSVVFR